MLLTSRRMDRCLFVDTARPAQMHQGHNTLCKLRNMFGWWRGGWQWCLCAKSCQDRKVLEGVSEGTGGGGGGDSLVPLQIDKRQEEVTITLCSCPSVVRWSQWKRRVGSAPWHCPACQEPSGRDSDLGHPCAVFCMKGRGKGVWDVSACDSFTGRAGGYEAVSVLMGRWQRSDRTYSIAATRGVSAWAVSVKLGQPAEELGLQLQHSPFMGNLQGAKLRLQQGGMKIPKAGA